MGASDLDIEFEDDEEIRAREEAERKKTEVVEDVDLDFSVGGGDAPASEAEAAPKKKKKKKKRSSEEATKTGISTPASEPEPAPESEPTPQEEPQIVHSTAPEVEQPVQPIQQVPTQTQTVTEVVQIGSNYQLGDELKRASAGNRVLEIEVEAKIKVAVAEEMAQVLADNKVFEHKMTKLIRQIAAKAPAAKKELIMLNNMVKEFTSDKKNAGKESKESGESRPTPVPKKKAS